MLRERGYTLSEAYALWRERADTGAATGLGEPLDSDDADGHVALLADGSDEE